MSWILLKYGGFFTWLFLNTVDMETVVWVALILQSFNLILPFTAVIRQLVILLLRRNENTDSGDYPGLLIPIQIYMMNSAKPLVLGFIYLLNCASGKSETYFFLLLTLLDPILISIIVQYSEIGLLDGSTEHEEDSSIFH
ncbi:hypothetical protein B9Z55_018213 [Caenorhabditis nigoni]|nr:hypothetical protein B9Z55_018213 [Caenorhabditis nigoni]